MKNRMETQHHFLSLNSYTPCFEEIEGKEGSI